MVAIIAHRPARARDTAVLVLAAGASRRLGRPKQLVRLGPEPLVRRAPRRARRLLVLTVDQWRVGGVDLARLLSTPRRCLVAAAYGGRLGVPAVFPRRLWPALLRLRGDRGARELLERGPTVPVPMPTADADLDTAAELAALRRARRASR